METIDHEEKNIMTRSFQVLDRRETIDQHTVLQASAGTGKTFSIENLVVRLLMDQSGPQLTEILVVTFTNAATRELRERVRSCLEQAIAILENPFPENCPDYLQVLHEEGNESRLIALRRLKQALLSFAEAQIFTIHGFCYRSLRRQLFEGNFSMHLELTAHSQQREELLRAVRDFLLTEVRKEFICLPQLKVLCSAYGNDTDRLIAALSKAAMGGEIILDSHLLEDRESVLKALEQLLSQGPYESECIVSDFLYLAPHYTGNYNKNGELKTELASQLQRFAKVMERGKADFLALEELFLCAVDLYGSLSPERVKKRGGAPPFCRLHYPQIFQEKMGELESCLLRALDPERLFAQVAYQCQILLRRRFKEDELLGPDDLLQAMATALEKPQVLEQFQSQYRAVIIDEFQDTDPIQWKIFQRLYLQHNPHKPKLYLVGDPKQSIYRFRYADIYTYFDALHALGQEALATLDTNYRSHPDLVEALNVLFAKEQIRRFIELPRQSKQLEYLKVKAGSSRPGIDFKDERGRLHIFCAEDKRGRGKTWPTELLETKRLLPFIAKEIQNLKKSSDLSYRKCAVLVRDRFQAERLEEILRLWKIPVSLRRSRSLVDSCALVTLKVVMEALLKPRDPGAVKRAWGTALLGGTEKEIAAMQETKTLEQACAQCVFLGDTLNKRGFAAFFEEFLHMESAIVGLSVAEQIVSQQEGQTLMQELQQLAELLMESRSGRPLNAEGFFQRLEDIERSDAQDERFLLRQDCSRDAVQVLTLHTSKGLEFDVVFALGLVNRTPVPQGLVTAFSSEGKGTQLLLCPNSEKMLAFLEEIDAEKMRTLYVGLTRAKDRLYVPLLIASDESSPPPLGTASPMELFFARLGNGTSTLKEDYEAVAQLQLPEAQKILEALHCPHISVSVLDHELAIPQLESPQLAKALQAPSLARVCSYALQLSSFSALSRPHKGGVEAQDDFPAGPEVGTVIHELLADYAFTSFLEDLNLQGPLKGTPLEDYALQTLDLLRRTVSCPLTEDPEFTLANIDESRCYKEMEFLFPWDGRAPSGFDLQWEGGFLKGFIDLIFEYRGKIYILDYKTNRLSDYSRSSLHAAMEQHDYPLQAWIYTEAVKRYLRGLGAELPFGGVFYCFLRGMTAPQEGVYHFFPEDFSC